MINCLHKPIRKKEFFIMTCKKCSYILYGSENYCPHCGEKCQGEEVPNQQKPEPEPKPIFISRDTSYGDIMTKGRIFQPEEAFEDISAARKEKARKKEKASSRGLLAFLSVLCLLLLCAAVFTAADYFDIAPAVADFFEQKVTTSESLTTTESNFGITSGTVMPQINYAPVNCTVSSAKSISLRKGPSEAYGQIFALKSGTEVQVTGGSAESENWVYVYVASEDIYGWVSASFISGELTQRAEKE